MNEIYEAEKDIDSAKVLISEFKKILPDRVDPISITLKSKIPYKAVSLRELLLYRITELGESAIELYEKKRTISAFIITRAVMETAALFYWLHKRLERVVDSNNIEDIDDFLMNVLFGWKGNKDLKEPYNILKAVDHLNKKVPHFRRAYDVLSEFTHPNYCGVHGAYGKIDKKNIWTDLGAEKRNVPIISGLSPLVGSLELFTYYYDEMTDLLPKFKEVCDNAIDKMKT